MSDFDASVHTITPNLGIKINGKPGLSRNNRNLAGRFNRTDIAKQINNISVEKASATPQPQARCGRSSVAMAGNDRPKPIRMASHLKPTDIS